MGIRMHMAKEWKERHLPTWDYDYSRIVRFYPKTYFHNNHQHDIEVWFRNHFDIGYEFFFSRSEDTGVPCEVGKGALNAVINNPKWFKEAVDEALSAGFADSEDEIRDFIKDALASDCDNDIVRVVFY